MGERPRSVPTRNVLQEGRGPAPAGRDESHEERAMAGVLPGRAGPGPVRAERLPDLDLGDDLAQRALPGAPAAVLPALAAVPADAGTGAAGAGPGGRRGCRRGPRRAARAAAAAGAAGHRREAPPAAGALSAGGETTRPTRAWHTFNSVCQARVGRALPGWTG